MQTHFFFFFQFFDRFLRESFLLIETKVNNRFSSHFANNPFLLQYMFSSYICPIIRNPLKSLLPEGFWIKSFFLI